MKSKRAMQGLTLIEVLIVLVISAILAGVAVPSYQNSIRKSARSAAKGALYDVVLRQEQFFMNNKSYSSSLANLGLPDPYYIDKSSAYVSSSNNGRVYQLTLGSTTATTYDAVATAVVNQLSDGCGNYTLKSDGTKSVSGAIGSADCW